MSKKLMYISFYFLLMLNIFKSGVLSLFQIVFCASFIDINFKPYIDTVYRVRHKEKLILASLASDFKFILAKQVLYSPIWRVTWFCTRQIQICIYTQNSYIKGFFRFLVPLVCHWNPCEASILDKTGPSVVKPKLEFCVAERAPICEYILFVFT